MHICTICNSKFTNEEGGIGGYFGIIPVQFCVWCLASMEEMVSSMNTEEEQ
jgi:hypothetical protein